MCFFVNNQKIFYHQQQSHRLKWNVENVVYDDDNDDDDVMLVLST
jgi:hypothetical protein